MELTVRASIEAQGFTTTAETFPDGTLVLSLLNSSGHTIAAGTWAQAVPADSPSIRPAEPWPARGAA